MYRRLGAALCAAVMMLAACGDSSGGGGDPGAAESCDDLVDAGIDMLNEVFAQLDELSLTEIAELGESGEEPEALADLEQRGQELETRAEELGCTDEELSQGLIDNLDKIEADGEFSQLLLQQLREDPDIFGN